MEPTETRAECLCTFARNCLHSTPGSTTHYSNITVQSLRDPTSLYVNQNKYMMCYLGFLCRLNENIQRVQKRAWHILNVTLVGLPFNLPPTGIILGMKRDTISNYIRTAKTETVSSKPRHIVSEKK